MEEKWTILQSSNVIDHPFLQVDLQAVQLPDGTVIPDWHWVHARDYVNVLAVDAAGNCLTLIGYKHGIGKQSWQTVGGHLEAGETPLAAAQRELLEEAGLTSDNWTPLGGFTVDANRHVGVGHFYLAQNVRYSAPPDYDDIETFESRWVTAPELAAALRDGRIAGISYALNIALALPHLIELKP